jgi:hypothetical protein
VLDNIKKDRSLVESAHHLAGRIIHKCLTSCLDASGDGTKNVQFLDHYEREIGRLVCRISGS